jgi:hypothetical protein
MSAIVAWRTIVALMAEAAKWPAKTESLQWHNMCENIIPESLQWLICGVANMAKAISTTERKLNGSSQCNG